jgi:chromatin segregation and condensation protein Rec8/ScpA/Scc1 (kleisin family)
MIINDIEIEMKAQKVTEITLESLLEMIEEKNTDIFNLDVVNIVTMALAMQLALRDHLTRKYN